MKYKEWVAKAAKQPMVLDAVDPGPLGVEGVEVLVETSGLCHSDLSVFNNEWGISQHPRDSRPRGHRSGHGHRPECQGSQGRRARRCRLELG